MPFGINSSLTSVPPWYEALYKKLGELSEKEAYTPYTAYPNSRLEPFNQDTTKAFGLGRNTGLYEPYFKQANQFLNTAAQGFPGQIDNYLNPYIKGVVDNIAFYGNKNLSEQILPQLESHFIGMGQHGSQRHADLAKRASVEAQGNISRQQHGALAQGYDTAGRMFQADQARNLEAANSSQNLGRFYQAGNVADTAALQEQGRIQQQFGQTQKDIDYNDYLRKMNYPREQLAHHAAALHGFQAPTQTTGVTYTQSAPQVNTLGSLGALAGSLYGTRMAAGHRKGGHITGLKAILPKSKRYYAR